MGSVSAVLQSDRTIPLQTGLMQKYGVGAALLIQQVHFWCSMGRNVVDGHEWVYNTYEEWGSQIGYSARQVRRFAKELVEKKVLIVANHNRMWGDRTLWYRVNYELLSELFESAEVDKMATSSGPKCPHHSGHNGRLHPAKMSAPIPEKSSEKNQILSKCVVPVGTDAVSESAPLKNEQGENETMNAKEILEKKNLGLKKKDTLVNVWRDTVSLVTDGKFQKPFTIKEASQLKKYGEYAGEHAIPTMRWALNNWWKFAQESKYAAGLPTISTKPDPGFLLKHCGIAVNMYLQSIAKSVVKPTPAPEKTYEPGPVLLPEKEKPYMPSDEEFEKLMAELNSKKVKNA